MNHYERRRMLWHKWRGSKEYENGMSFKDFRDLQKKLELTLDNLLTKQG